jgi:hypothetical protein
MDAFTPKTLKLLQSVLDDAWMSLRPGERARTSKTQVAIRILEAASAGERDPTRLRIQAVTGVVTTPL